MKGPSVSNPRLLRLRNAIFVRRRIGWLLFAVMLLTTAALTRPVDPLQAEPTGQTLRKRKPLPSFLRNPVLAKRYLSTRDVEELLQFELAEPVCEQLLRRPGVPLDARSEAAHQLARLRSTDSVAELLSVLQELDAPPEDSSPGQFSSAAELHQVLTDLGELLADQERPSLEKYRPVLQRLAKQARNVVVRRAAWAALLVSQDSEEVWRLAADDKASLSDLLEGLAMLPGRVVQGRAALYDHVVPLVESLTRTDSQIRSEADESQRRLRRAAVKALGFLQARPQEAFRLLTWLITTGVEPDDAVEAICRIPADRWPAEDRATLAGGLVDHLRQMSLEDRGGPRGTQSLKLLERLLTRLPSEIAAPFRGELDRLAVMQVEIRTLPEKMAYDRTVLVARPGQGLRVVFRNDDIMPHNLVFVDSPEAREIVGIASDRMQNDPEFIRGGYLPDSSHLLHATPMLQPGESYVLAFTAPESAGTYAYLCTFPGHWIKMYGALLVTQEEAMLRATPEELPTADDLLGIETVEWTYDQLAGDLSHLDQGRSYPQGERLFLKASCFSCHQMRGQGGKIGPDLTKISDKYKQVAELLRHIMNPSEKVDPEYATVIVETADGRVIRGVLVGEDEQSVQVSVDPLKSCEPTVIAKEEIEEITRSRLSPMPEGLLNTIVDKGQVYDLLAYLMAGGDPASPLYAQKGVRPRFSPARD